MTDDKKALEFSGRVELFSSTLLASVITDKYGRALEVESGMQAAQSILVEARRKKSSVFIVGNGGSSAVASHAVIDLINVARLRAFTLHEPSVLTCMANDYGYENVYLKQLEHMALAGDVLIAISSSGKSMNIRGAAEQVSKNGGKVITLSGFAENNPLRGLGDINIWLDSMDYGMVEVGHQFVLHNLSDRFGAAYTDRAK